MPDIKSEKWRADPPAPSPNMELAVIEISREEFQACKKRRIAPEEKRSEAANVFTPYHFMPDDIKEEDRDRDDPLASAPAPAPPNMFTPYVFHDESLGQDSDANAHIDYWRDSLSPKQRLRFALKKLLECEFSQTLAITAEHKVGTDHTY